MVVVDCRRAAFSPVWLITMICGWTAGTSVAVAADWFVAPGPASGDGSRDKPFHDPWRALAAAAPGDVIHIAEGTYYGRYDRSAWEVDRPRITILGGYDKAFSRRDPWKQPSIFAFNRDYEGASEINLFNGRDDHTGLVLDGLVFDGGGRNRYDAKAPMGLRGGLTMVGPLVSLASPDVTLRNCVLINSTTGALEMRGEGSRVENNIFLNHHGTAMLAFRESGSRSGGSRPMVVRGNTFAFAHDDTDPPMGRGGDKGVGIRCSAPAQIENNAFIACGNAAVQVFAKPGSVGIDRNLFALSPRANVTLRDGGRESLITDRNLEEMEDLGLKSCQANRAAGDIDIAGLKEQWIDGVTRQIWLSYARPPKEGLTKLRARYKLPEPAGASGDDHGPVAPYVDPRDACAMRVGGGEAGARPIELKVVEWKDAGRTAASSGGYQRVEWADFNAGPRSLDGKRVEIVAAIGQERNGFLLSGMTNERYLGFDVYYPGGDRGPDQIHVYALRNGAAHRQWQDATKSTNAREAEDWYLLRGILRLTGVRQKSTLEVESIIPTQGPEKKPAAPPKGRDWYVRAGATGGDGSKEKPFRDPFQPLEKAQPGDAIHVAAGDYFGKLRAGTWGIGTMQLSLLGGYDGEFKSRDPWKHPTRLIAKAPDSGETLATDRPVHDGTFLQSTDRCDGLILDGFVFDGSTANAYYDAASGGGLNLGSSPAGIMVKLGGLGLTVRNCVFVNASGIAVDLAAPFGTFENNTILNTSGTALIITAIGPGPWIIRHNTLLFATDPTARAGTGLSTAMGSLLLLRGRAAARIEGNLFAFADNYAIRATTPRDKLSLDGNVFDANLYCHFTDGRLVWLHDAGWDRRLADAAFPSARDNALALPPGLPIDKDYADRVLPRFFEKKGRYKRDDLARMARAIGATVTPPADEGATAAAPAEEKPQAQKKEQSLDDLIAELDKMKKDRAGKTGDQPAAAPKGPPYCPAYPWKKAMELAREPGAGAVGARRGP